MKKNKWKYTNVQLCNYQKQLNHTTKISNKQKKETKKKTPIEGIEPSTTWLRVMRSTIWAKRAIIILIYNSVIKNKNHKQQIIDESSKKTK